MNPLPLLGCFFAMVMGAITLAGYVLFYRDTRFLAEQAFKYEGKLALAGYRAPGASNTFLWIKFGLAAALGLLFGLLRLLIAGSGSAALAAFIAGVGLGYLLPDRILEYACKSRSRRLQEGIPTAIDLLVLSLEAGQSIDAAVADTAREIHVSFADLSGEFNQMRMEMLASRGRGEVFQSLRDRTSEPELKRLCQVFIDSDRFGTGLAPALRNHVKYLRIRLRQQAQEQARKVGVKLIFPVFFLIFPAVILVTLGPAVLQIYAELGPLVNSK